MGETGPTGGGQGPTGPQGFTGSTGPPGSGGGGGYPVSDAVFAVNHDTTPTAFLRTSLALVPATKTVTLEFQSVEDQAIVFPFHPTGTDITVADLQTVQTLSQKTLHESKIRRPETIGALPTVTNFNPGVILNMNIRPGSNGTSGIIQADGITDQGTGTFLFTVTFEPTEPAVQPRAILLTAMNEHLPLTGMHYWVADNFTSTEFSFGLVINQGTLNVYPIPLSLLSYWVI